MPRSMKVMLAVCAVLAALGALLMWLATPAHAHDWYTFQTQIKEPDWYSGRGCCDGNDCAPVPIDADWIGPDANGLHVTLTLEQARLVNPKSDMPVDEVVSWNRVQSPPKEAKGPAVYHLCISTTGRVLCLFAVPST